MLPLGQLHPLHSEKGVIYFRNNLWLFLKPFFGVYELLVHLRALGMTDGLQFYKMALITRLAIPLAKTWSCRPARTCFVLSLRRRCRLLGLRNLTLPEPVTLNLLAIPLCVLFILN